MFVSMSMHMFIFQFKMKREDAGDREITHCLKSHCATDVIAYCMHQLNWSHLKNYTFLFL